MINGPILVTERLILRPPGPEDFEAFAAFSKDEETTKFIGGVMDKAAAWRAWCSYAGSWHINGFGMFSYILRKNGAWIGRGGPWQPYGWPGKEISWGLARAYEGQGYALEANRAIIDFAFEILDWDSMIHTIDPENRPSIRLAERLGSSNQGPTQLPAPFAHFRVDAYGQSREDWRGQKHKQEVA